MELDDPYRELGLTPEASDAQVKAAWRRLAARWHPDRNASPQALQRIQRINRAIEAIRQARGDADEAGQAPPPPPSAEEESIEHVLSLSLEEAARGCVREVQGEIARACTVCSASGLASAQACASCGGEGQLRQALWFGWLTASVSCEACGGAGTTNAPCAGCGGSGHETPRRYRGRLRIPPGVREGQRLQARVRVQGSDGQQPVDVRISLQPHEFLTLEANGMVRVEVPVDGFAWVAGHWIEVPTPYGLRQMRLQRGALTYRIRGEGFPAAPEGSRADCLVTVVPLFPQELNSRQSALLDKLIAANTGDPASEAGARMQAWAGRVAQWQERNPASDS